MYTMGILMRYMLRNCPLEKLEIDYCLLPTIKQIERLTVAILDGYFGDTSMPISVSNMFSIVKFNGIEIIEIKDNKSSDHTNAINIKFKSRNNLGGSIRGAVIGGQPMLVGVNSSSFNIPLGGIICLYYKDEINTIKAIEDILKKTGVNILRIPIDGFRPHKLMLLAVDKDIPTYIISKISGMVRAKNARIINLIG